MNRCDQRGITMVELMVAMVLMAVALLALAATFPYALYGIAVSGAQTTATLLAQDAIERVKAADYESIAALRFDGATGPPPTDCQGSGGLRAVPAHAGFTRCVAVRTGTPSANTTTIIAVVEAAAGPSPPWRTTVATIRGGN